MGAKPFSQACENNKAPIAAVLAEVFADRSDVLEVGSGTGQHAVHMAAELPWLQWQCADRRDKHPAIVQWLEGVSLTNVRIPLELDIGTAGWPVSCAYSAIFSANTLHIMSWPQVELFFAGMEQSLAPAGKLCIYGPFNYGGKYTSDSNAAFDQWLQRSPGQAIRDFEMVCDLAASQGLVLQQDYPLPANNRLLYWIKS